MAKKKKVQKQSLQVASLKAIFHQNEVIIALLGRIAFTEEDIKNIIKKKKKAPKKYLMAYNACDGQHTVSQLAKIAGVGQPTMTQVLKLWEEHCIIYEVGKFGGKFYKKLFFVRV